MAQRTWGLLRNTIACAACGAAALLLAPVAGARAEEDDDARDYIDLRVGNKRFELKGNASAEDVGIGVYPGAQRRARRSDDSNALRLGLWSPEGGVRLALVKYRSADAPEKVAAWYRTELARFGAVLECGPSGRASSIADADDEEGSDEGPTGDDDEDDDDRGCTGDLKRGATELRVGSRRDRRIVAVTPAAGGSELVLLRVRLRGEAR
jgi:hypothetical protein